MFEVSKSLKVKLFFSNEYCACKIDFQTFNVLRGLYFFVIPANLGESSEIESEDDDDEGSSTSQDDKEAPDGKPAKENKAKPRDDLAMYEKFFPELFEFQVGLCN